MKKTTSTIIREKLRGRTVLVTGADGFVGSHLTEALINFDADVHVLVRPTSSEMLHNLKDIKRKIKIHRADLTDKQAVEDAISSFKRTTSEKPLVFHLGAQAHVGESWVRSYETINTNILGTINLLQSLVDLKLKPFKFVFAGSSEEYGNIYEEMKDYYKFDKSGGLILNEKTPLNPQSIYAVSKVAGDFLTRIYYSAYGLQCVVARKFNNYGPRQNPRFITPTIITQALERKNIKLGYLGAKRDFTYVKDGIMGYIHLGIFGIPGQVYCFGSGKTITMKNWLELILKVGKELGYWENKKVVCEKSRGRLGKSEVEELRVDYSKLNKLTGWKPSYSWEKGIAETIKWYAENKEAWKGRIDWD
jgi:dTDP-glucose 4,6-dehydratase